MNKQDQLKIDAAKEALSFLIKDLKNRTILDNPNTSFWLGIGSGSTVKHFITLLGEAIRQKTISCKVKVITTSFDSELELRKFSIQIFALEDLPSKESILFYIDGADEIDQKGRALKGLGGASTREKLVWLASTQRILMIDESKLKAQLGIKAPLVCEVLPFGFSKTIDRLWVISPKPDQVTLRYGTGKMGPIVTDNGNFLVDIYFNKGIPNYVDLEILEEDVKVIPGVVETGLFSKSSDFVFVSSPEGVKFFSF